MFDYNSDFDPAPTTSGPWLRFYAKASQQGDIPAGAWALKDAGSTTVLNLSKGFVLDWPAVKTGWVQGEGIPGVAPVKRWNPSRARFEPKPAGDKWHRGFLAPVAYEPDAMAIWEQWGAGVWISFSEMFVGLLRSAPAQLPKLPYLIPVGDRLIKFAHGPSLVPKLMVSCYVPRPACLPEGDTSPPPIATQPQQHAQVSYSHPPTQTIQSTVSQPHGSAPIQPAGWDVPVPPSHHNLAPPNMMNMGGTAVPIPGQEPRQTPQKPPDGLLDPDDIGF
jgi:hypothetical protein